MTITTHSVAAQKTLDAFTLASLTQGVAGDGWDWAAEKGKTIILTSNGVAPMNDYNRTGVNRFGTPAEIDNDTQEIACTRDRSFSFTIDKMGRTDRAMTIEAAKQLRKQIDEVITPEVDIWTLSKLVAEADNVVSQAVTKSNAYEQFLNLNGKLDDAKVPAINRVAWVTPAFYNMIKLDPTFTKASESTVKALTSGFLGDVDGVALVKAPTSYMPEGAMVVLAHKDAWCQPIRLEDYRTHQDPPGISGWLVEGRIVYDAFVLERLTGGKMTKDGVAVLKSA
jgi:hypothetical protein